MKTKAKKIMLVIAAIIIIIGIGASMTYHKPHTDVAKADADISISMEDLIHDFENNENAANANYLEKIIEVTGTISGLEKEMGKGIVLLNSADSFSSIRCHLTYNEHEKFNTLQEGQTITIKGICTGYLMDVILVKCVIQSS